MLPCVAHLTPDHHVFFFFFYFNIRNSYFQQVHVRQWTYMVLFLKISTRQERGDKKGAVEVLGLGSQRGWGLNVERKREGGQERDSQSTCWIICALKRLITVSGYTHTHTHHLKALLFSVLPGVSCNHIVYKHAHTYTEAQRAKGRGCIIL